MTLTVVAVIFGVFTIGLKVAIRPVCDTLGLGSDSQQ
jgi:hypothetical protein